MGNVIKHRFVSPKADGPDLTQVQPAHWNDGHSFTGGAAGDVLMRDPPDFFGANWQPQSLIGGIWVDRAFNASLFSAPSGSWVVGSVPVNAYSKQGHTVTLSLSVNASVITGTPAYLIVGTADFLGPAVRQQTGLFHYWCGEYSGVGYGVWDTTTSTILLSRDVGGTPFGATSTLYIKLTIIGSV